MNMLYGDGKNGKMIFCVLEPGNIHKLIDERKPIEIRLNEGPFERGLPAKLTVVIGYSETPVGDSVELEKMLSAQGVKIDQRSPVVRTKTPHCQECRSTIEQLGVWRSNTPVWLIFCVVCGCTLGSMPNTPALETAGGD